jgi:hypothetical protein
MNEETVKNRLRAWIAGKNGTVSAEQITDSTPIVEQRVLASLHVAELLVFMSEIRGRSIDIESLRPGGFRDLNTIYATFFARPNDEH